VAAVTYYYFVSLVLLAVAIYTLVVLIYLTSTSYLSRTRYKPGTAAYTRIRGILNLRVRTAFVVALTVLAINLICVLRKVLNLHTSSSHLLLIFAPVLVAILTYVLHRIFWEKTLERSSLLPMRHTSNKEQKSWLK
jgi:drug/metabolite transporter (DMT)-like permease